MKSLTRSTLLLGAAAAVAPVAVADPGHTNAHHTHMPFEGLLSAGSLMVIGAVCAVAVTAFLVSKRKADVKEAKTKADRSNG